MMTRNLLLTLILLAPAAFCQNIAYNYDAAGRLALVDYGNGTQIAYSYDNAGNLLSRTVTSASLSQEPQPTIAAPARASTLAPRATGRKKKQTTRKR